MANNERRTVIVTGGAQGLGKAICRTLADEYEVIVADIQEAKAKQFVQELKDNGGNATFMRLDVSKEDSVQEVVFSVMEKFGRIDVVINNAGVDVTKSIAALSVEEWDRVVGVNLRGPFLMAKASLPIMASQKSGHIVNVVSTAGLRAWTEASAYHATKWGLRGFSQALFTEARQHNVKVTAVIAGGMKTPFLLDRFPDLDQTKLQDPENVAVNIQYLLKGPAETAVPEIIVIPLMESSWP